MVQVQGPEAYSTSGWLGLDDRQIAEHITSLQQQGFRHFKSKVGGNLEQDIERLGFLRRLLGEEAFLMTDANQIWGVNEAIEWMKHLKDYHPYWIEEPTARDDVLGFVQIRKAMQHSVSVSLPASRFPHPLSLNNYLSQAL